MSDDPFYLPNRQPTPRRPRQPGEPLWSLRPNHVAWSCELRFHGESYGWEAQIFRDGDFTWSRRFLLRQGAEDWAREQEREIQAGWLDHEGG